MSEVNRAYIVVFAISAFGFFLLSRWSSLPKSHSQIQRWAGYWIIVTSAAFLTHNYWVFVFVVTGLILFASPRASDQRVSMYFLLLPALPILLYEIPGIGGIRYFFNISYPRLLVILIFLPLAVQIFRKDRSAEEKPFFPSDKYLFAYAGLTILLGFREASLTNALRSGLYVILDILIPYYVISRNVKSLEDFKSVFHAVVASVFVLSIIAWFESLKVWLLYRSLNDPLDMTLGRFSGYGSRAGNLRVSTTMGPIPSGYFFTIGYGAFFFLRPYFPGLRFIIISGVIIVALLATVSRGPWVGFAALIFVLAFYSPHRMKALSLLAVGLIFGFLLLTILPGGQTFLSILPFVGDTGHTATTVSYRQQLLENGIEVFMKNPVFGSESFRQTSEMEDMRQGQHIIDVVNTYLAVGLEKGFVGLSLFAGFFSSLLLGIRKGIILSRSLGEEYARLGQALLAILAAILVIIATVSSVLQIPIYYWAMAGLGAAYVNMISLILKTNNQTITNEGIQNNIGTEKVI